MDTIVTKKQTAGLQNAEEVSTVLLRNLRTYIEELSGETEVAFFLELSRVLHLVEHATFDLNEINEFLAQNRQLIGE
jgi:hypothetical protein